MKVRTVSRGLRGRPRVAKERAEAEIVAIALDLDFGHVDEARQAFEGGNGVGAHDLGRNEEVEAVDEADGEEGRVEPSTRLSEKREDAFLAKFVENFLERNPACIRRKHFDAYATALKIADASFVMGDGEDDDVLVGRSK